MPQHLVWPLFIASLVVVLACTVHQIRAVISKRSSPGAGSVNQAPHAARVNAAAKPMPKWLKWGLLGCAAVFALVVSSKIADRIRLANSEPYKAAGLALLEFTVSGPLGKGQARVEAIKGLGKWWPMRLGGDDDASGRRIEIK